MSDQSVPKYAVKSTGTAFDIIEVLKNGPAGVTEIAEKVNISKSGVHNQLTTLKHRGYVYKRNGEYRLGLRFLTLGGGVRNMDSTYREIYETAKPEMETIADDTSETVCLLVEEEQRGIVLHQAQGDDAVKTTLTLGTELPFHCTAMGKAVLAHLPEEVTESIIEERGLPQQTKNTITSEARLLEQLEKVQNRGYAIDSEERREGIIGVASPIRDTSGRPLGALGISGPTRRIQGERLESELPQLVQQAARMIELDTQYEPIGESDGAKSPV